LILNNRLFYLRDDTDAIFFEICKFVAEHGNKWDSGSAVSRNLFVVVQRKDFKWSRDLQNGKAAKLNVEQRIALLQKEEIENRKKILELEHAFKENEEIKSRSNAALVNSWLKGRINNSVAGGKRRFCGMDKTQSNYHSDQDLQNNDRGMMTITNPVNQKSNFNIYPGNCQQDPDVNMLLTRQILGQDLPEFSGETRKWPSFVTTYRSTTDDCQFTESEHMERLRKSLEAKARQCENMVLLTNNAERVIEILRKNYGYLDDVILNQLIEEVQQQCPFSRTCKRC
jgi:hypothetical protein